jgi:putative intracellular protease/amidase
LGFRRGGMIRLAIPLFQGFDELDVVGPFEVLRAAELAGAALHTELVSFDGQLRFTATHGLSLEATGVLDDSWDWVVVPGGAWRLGDRWGLGRRFNEGCCPRDSLSCGRRAKVWLRCAPGA